MVDEAGESLHGNSSVGARWEAGEDGTTRPRSTLRAMGRVPARLNRTTLRRKGRTSRWSSANGRRSVRGGLLSTVGAPRVVVSVGGAGTVVTPTGASRWLRRSSRWSTFSRPPRWLPSSSSTRRRSAGWASAGKIASTRTAGGHRRFRRADVQALVPVKCRQDPPGDRGPVASVRRPSGSPGPGIEHELDDAVLALTEAAGAAAAATEATTRALAAARRVGASGTVDAAGRASCEAALLVASTEAVEAAACVTRQVEDASQRLAAAAGRAPAVRRQQAQGARGTVSQQR